MVKNRWRRLSAAARSFYGPRYRAVLASQLAGFNAVLVIGNYVHPTGGSVYEIILLGVAIVVSDLLSLPFRQKVSPPAEAGPPPVQESPLDPGPLPGPEDS